ncbi:transglycosylase domain-containing protein [Alicyclobacillus herbarius]|uniref:transglycosylase domain-containing protein n=1 Tax=Alicyclobacillus herbarius TaxID=122960 RepID=UPI00041E0776|nr:transglycosylase domain-containing protein [Alicyclobacillus herbarius]
MGDTPKRPSDGRPEKGHTAPDARTPTARSERSRRRRIVIAIVKTVLMSAASLIVLGLGAGVGYAKALLKGLPSISAATFTNLSQPSVVYDRNGMVIGKFDQDGTRQPISSMKQVSNNLVDAFVAGEDKTFWTNIGINPVAMGRALLQDVTHHHIESGASTITQQTVKLAVFPEQQQTLRRKVQEIALALKLNHILTKPEIMTDYMNWVWMGNMGGRQVYGVQAASRILFHKSAKDLNLPEAAFLASIPNNPAELTPYRFDTKKNHYVIDPSPVIPRQHYILEQMRKNGMITESQYKDAMSFDIKKDLHLPPKISVQYPYLMLDEIKPWLEKQLVKQGLYTNAQQVDAALPTAGYKIYTTFDLHIQDHIDQVLADPAFYAGTQATRIGPNGKAIPNPFEAGAALIDNHTGAILALGGGDGKTNVDHSDVPRPPGSSIKPLVDYGPALDMHAITAATPLEDAPISYYKNGNVHDDDMRWRGVATARQALTWSYNVPAIVVLHDIGPENGTKYLEKMGISPGDKTIEGRTTLTQGDLHRLSTAIGGLHYGLTVQQMTSAYTTLANQGVWHQSYFVSKIVGRDGQTVYQVHPQVHKVFSPQATFVLDSMLRDVVTQGTATMVNQHFPGQYIYGKTGTSDDEHDGWFIGFTQDYTLGLWTGYDYPQHIPSSVYNRKFTMWNDIMDPLLKDHPSTKPLPRPSGLVRVAVCKYSGQLPTAPCKVDGDVYTEWFIQGTQPTKTCDVHVQLPYVVYQGKKYLATTNTPINEIEVGIFLKLPFSISPNVKTEISSELAPTQPDPRGGIVLSSLSSARLAARPAAPKLSGSLFGDGVELTWSSSDKATEYSVWRALKADGPYVKIADHVHGTQYLDKSVLQNSGSVYYRVYALSASGLSSASNTVAVQLKGPSSPPANSTGNSADNGTGAVTPPQAPGNHANTPAPAGPGQNSANSPRSGDAQGADNNQNGTSNEPQ